ncbi:MAG: 50S ribosomal protein L16 [Candidatus Zambryskibacteria bacterium]|nr:50S ribosomal protein L16 [Candidatus Zambryskibacteria bacterium]
MLFPKKVKYRKWHIMRKNPNKISPATRGIEISFGSHGLKAISAGRVTSNQIEAARKIISRNLGKTGRVWVRIFPDMPFTKKPAEVKMGKGKGDIEGYQVRILPGQVLFEAESTSEIIARESLRKGGCKMPVKTKIVTRQ